MATSKDPATPDNTAPCDGRPQTRLTGEQYRDLVRRYNAGDKTLTRWERERVFAFQRLTDPTVFMDDEMYREHMRQRRADGWEDWQIPI